MYMWEGLRVARQKIWNQILSKNLGWANGNSIGVCAPRLLDWRRDPCREAPSRRRWPLHLRSQNHSPTYMTSSLCPRPCLGAGTVAWHKISALWAVWGQRRRGIFPQWSLSHAGRLACEPLARHGVISCVKVSRHPHDKWCRHGASAILDTGAGIGGSHSALYGCLANQRKQRSFSSIDAKAAVLIIL